MRILEVGGEGDYSALTFENHYLGADLNAIWERAYARPHHTETLKFAQEDGTLEEVEIYAYQFKEVDPDFIDLIKNEFIDDDDSKNHNFYVVENNKKENTHATDSTGSTASQPAS